MYHLLKTKKNQKIEETGDTNYIYKNEFDKACFQHDMAYGDCKDLAKKAAADKVSRDEPFNFAKNPKYNRYQRGLLLLFTSFFDKTSPGNGVNMHVNNERLLDLATKKLAVELHKQITRKF